jgi:DNA polymerase-3 subunit delta
MAAETFESIAADLKGKKFAPVYFFCGEEDFFIDALTELVETHGLNDMEKAFNQTIVYGKDLTSRQIMETAGRLPMMAERQVIIVKEAQALAMKEADEEEYLRYLKKPVKSTVLVFAWKHGTPDGRKSFGKEMKKSAVYFESKPLYQNQVAPWVKNWLSQKKYKIEEQAAELLVEYTGNELSKVANELEKLIINKQPGATITLDDIENGVGISKEYNTFELNNALGNRDKTKTYQIVNYFIANPKNGPLVLILGTLQGFFSKIFLFHLNKNLPDKDIASAIKVSPFFLKDYRSAVANYNPQKLEQVFKILEEFDLRSKGVNNRSLKEGELLKEMVARILS